MPFETKFDFQKSIINLTRDLKINILVVKGWGFNNVQALNGIKSIKVIENAPFDKLIPRVNAVVHHGGIGTVAQCLRSGVPFLSCPVIYPMGDQHFWAKQAYRKGCSPEPIPLKKLRDHTLNQRVFEMLTSETLHKNSVELAKLMAEENGVENAIDVIEANFR